MHHGPAIDSGYSSRRTSHLGRFGSSPGTTFQPWGRHCGPSCGPALACSATGLLVRDAPRQSFLVVVVIIYCGAFCAFAATTRVQAGQLRVAATLLACSTVVELVHCHKQARIGHAYAIWDLPGAVVLPPLYALLSPVLRMALPRVRACHGQPDRRARIAADGLGYAVASEAFHVLAPFVGTAGTGTGWRVMLWTVLVAGCGLLGRTAYNGLVLVAGRDAVVRKRLLPEIAGEAVLRNVAELSLGTLAAVAVAHSVLAVVYAVPLVISLQRSAHVAIEARVDGKTGLLNDKTWRREAIGEISRAARTRTPLALGIIDIDHFKRVNDTHGHPAGDAVLSSVAATAAALLRPYDLIGRVGGEEFAFVLPNSPFRKAAEVAERLREAISIALPIQASADQMTPHVTVSIGVAAAERPGWDLDRYLSHADQALYAAKRAGRDAVWIVSPENLEPEPACREGADEPFLNVRQTAR
jgi:diguanylate cyclase (GGDEF)-like protein